MSKRRSSSLKVINICGPIAVGKTTMCNRLMQFLQGYVFVDRAYFENVLKPVGVPLAELVADDMIYVMVRRLMEAERPILVQEADTNRLYDVFSSSKNCEEYDFHSFFLTCSVEEAIKRDRRRGDNTPEDIIRETHRSTEFYVRDIDIDTETHNVGVTQGLILQLTDLM